MTLSDANLLSDLAKYSMTRQLSFLFETQTIKSLLLLWKPHNWF